MLKSDKVVSILLKNNYIEQSDLDKVQATRSENSKLELLLDSQITNWDLITQAIAEEYKIEFLDLDSSTIDPSLQSLLPGEIRSSANLVVASADDSEVVIAGDDPENFTLLQFHLAEIFAGKKVSFKVSTPSAIRKCLSRLQQPVSTRLQKLIDEKENVGPEFFATVIEDAIDQNASDIHIEPFNEHISLRYRTDGMLHEIVRLPPSLYEIVLNRVKVLAGMRLDEHSRPQDGAIHFDSGKRELDLRVSIVPTVKGSKVVIRLLSDYLNETSLSGLGFSDNNRDIVRQASHESVGMILTVGPTGSGKTTTLYSILKSLNTDKVNITTIEDPVEYKIQGLNQIQVNTDVDLTFARGLRSIVRQDPNIILVGEIRDVETAEIAINAALTGHLLLSTFHANDAATAIPRLLNMGIEPFLLSSTLKVIVAQRLVRKLCLSCRQSYKVSYDKLGGQVGDVDKYFPKGEEATLYTAKGCQRCGNTGYLGRTAIFELIYNTPEIQELILQKADSHQINEAARRQGAKSFFEDGIEKVKTGIIDLEELKRVAPTTSVSSDIYAKKKT
ncbi:type II/IV secretion system protein [Candidatus Dojkabacteria bacterium]|uniref:Type II/IV secretion system protein n=1 Tax=Candidatus Dojkabacteria bacterium TaxID=2099670 RepID=A0A955I5M6_9BACT|nr:type II/IV secretion system protein [Candidatus Dojkabacteria bacterium]